MAVRGVFASESGIAGDRKGDFAGSLLQTNPTGSAPLFALSSGMATKPANDTVVTWFEENKLQGRVDVTNNATTGTSLVVSDGSFVVPGQVWMIETTGELVFVTAVAGTTVTVERGFASTSVVSINGSSTAVPIQKISTAHEEGAEKPVAYSNLGFPRFNYCHIFRTTWDVTGTARAVQYHTGDQVARNKRDALLFHSEEIELSSWFSKKSIGHMNGRPYRTMDGIVTQITTNVQSQQTHVTYTDLRGFLQDVFSYNIKGQPNERIAFCGNTVLGVIDTLAKTFTTMNVVPGATEFGMKINKWITPFGEISLMTHPLFNESPLWTKDLHVLHPGAMRTRYLRQTHHDGYDKDGTRAGRDADFGVYTTEMCIEYMAERTGGRFTGIDTPYISALQD